jgi:hypothetical protein
MAIMNSTDFAVDKAASSLCHVASARPHEVKNIETLVPRVSAFLIEHGHVRVLLQRLSNLAWVLGATASFVLYFDGHGAAWLAILSVGMLPSILLSALAFDRELLKGIATTFQTALVWGHTMIMIGSLCALFHNQPFKLVGIIMALPSLMCAAFIDAYPAAGRAYASRLFFVLNLICLVLVQVGLAFGIARIDEFVLEMYGGWRFKASELAGGAISSLVPFGVRNLVASIKRPTTLAVRQSDVACLYLDKHALRVLRAVHAYLMDDESASGEVGLVVPSVVQGAVGVALAGM